VVTAANKPAPAARPKPSTAAVRRRADGTAAGAPNTSDAAFSTVARSTTARRIGESAEQRAVAQQVDAPRHATRQLWMRRKALRSNGSDRSRPAISRRCAMYSCVSVRTQRVQVKARDDALCQLLEFGLGQHGAQFGLADEDDLQQLAFTGFQVGEQPQLLQDFGRRFCASSMISRLLRPLRAP
jgi:hypothetical protein